MYTHEYLTDSDIDALQAEAAYYDQLAQEQAQRTMQVSDILNQNTNLRREMQHCADDLCAAYDWPRSTVAAVETVPATWQAACEREEKRSGVRLVKFFHSHE